MPSKQASKVKKADEEMKKADEEGSKRAPTPARSSVSPTKIKSAPGTKGKGEVLSKTKRESSGSKVYSFIVNTCWYMFVAVVGIACAICVQYKYGDPKDIEEVLVPIRNSVEPYMKVINNEIIANVGVDVI